MMNKTLILVIEKPKKITAYRTFRALCQERGWSYQTLANSKATPSIDKPVVIEGVTVHRVEIRQ